VLPFIGRRTLMVIPSLVGISVVAFVVIALPPGDFVDRLVLEALKEGEHLTDAEIADLRTYYQVDRPLPEQYLMWVGNIVLRGDLGTSFRWDMPVADLIGERLGLTALLSTVTLVLIWTVAIPVGIYSAVRRYSLGDYLATFFGFIGLATPNFLLALVLLYISLRYFGQSVGGLFSPDYINAPWSLGKVGDLLSHLWIPAIVLGTAGTASVIRIVRANLLDELHAPYYLAARAKGLLPGRALLKYPVRHAMNPFVSSLNELFVTIVSGETIVAVVLGLQTTGPLLLEALKGQDMHLAATLIMFLSFLAVLGTLFSDILLAWLDPRICRQIQRGEAL